MTTATVETTAPETEVRDSWIPMIVIAMGQAFMSFNVAAIPVSMSGMVESFQTPPTTVGTAIVFYSLGVSGFIMLGAKLGQRFGSKLFFQASVGLFLLAMVLMVLSPTAEVMLAGQFLAGFAAAGVVPTLVVLIAVHYRGKQQAEAVGWLGSARAIAGVLAFVIVGGVATWLSWRWAFGLLVLHGTVLLLLSFKLKPAAALPEVKIDLIGVVLSAVSITLITFGFNNLRSWGVLLAREAAPFDLVGVSPAPAMIVVGVALFAAFLAWSHRRVARRKTPLIALEVIDSPLEWMTVVALFTIVGMEGAINFSVPLYLQIVQSLPPVHTSIAMMPFMLTVFFTAILIVKLYNRFTPRQIATGAYLLVAAGTAWLAFVVRNDWSTVPVIAGLFTVGLGQGALVTLLFNVLVTASPKELAGDVGSLRGVTQNLGAAVGTAVVGALLVGLLSAMIIGQWNLNPVVTAELKDEANLTNLNFFSDAQLKEKLAGTSATPEQFDEALRINAEARIQALKVGFLCLSGLALLAIFPCRWLPTYKPGEIPSASPSNAGERPVDRGN
jgi:MFS family permease